MTDKKITVKPSMRGKNRSRGPNGVPHAVDIHVGKRLRMRRTLLGLTQNAVAKSVGLTFQQLQKYERGGNRIGASRLYDLAQALDVPVSYFFDDLPESVAESTSEARRKVDLGREAELDVMAKRETLELVRAYYKLNGNQRKRFFDLVKSMSDTEGNDDVGTA
ncbi:Transcriptional regulator, contains XRE-family HTH domain [Thalassospira xiamenensis M-5 = DSM 17429]|uniref:Transcriptional regulator n=1 Tax=Thalassospira xiamenensis M-5 = DSM 17429 TaxID=1123366 RepID=A0AB72UIX1_9PROT|nr:helix-turn-helix transcriptional regulator [Thalassospira xiamenensis]AJD54436.1 transcriptional regulator [Thalassospira xiamenensis M-5 = DSM 17429]SIT22180.1 Transcriptional regulator, contains XRE-family HTH domain [Thalassospira xiamenensis M-5 = DSM 17429]